MKNPTRAERILEFFVNNPGTHKTSEVADVLGISVKSASTVLSKLASEGKIEKIQNGIYRGKVSEHTQQHVTEARENLASDVRGAENNEQTINKLLNTYDEVLSLFQVWVLQNINKDIDFEKQILFLEHFKSLTMIADKLMKRWALVHIGYDTNSRQAQEDAKAKTAEKEKQALENASLEDTVEVLGSFNLKTKQLIDNFPTHDDLENLSEKDTEEITV